MVSCVRRCGAFSMWEMEIAAPRRCRRGLGAFSRFQRPGSGVWRRSRGRNARWSTCRSCARWGSPGAPLSIGCRTGVEALRALLKAEDDTGFTRSEAERILRRPIAAAKLEAPVFNTYVMGLEADAVGPVHRVAIDVDGFAAHGHQAALERDRARDNALVVAGCLVLRFTWRQLTREPMVVLASIVQALTVRIHTNLLVPKTVGSVQT